VGDEKPEISEIPGGSGTEWKTWMKFRERDSWAPGETWQISDSMAELVEFQV
jgi:hypothetical protein